MPHISPRINIPHTDLWTAIFGRTERQFPDHQVIFQCPVTLRNYTYSNLRQTTEQFGRGLRRYFSWSKGEVLAIHATNDIDTPMVTWGTHWAGGVVSPANPAYNGRELTHHLRHSGAKVLVTQEKLLSLALKCASEVGITEDRIIVIGGKRKGGKRYREARFWYLEDILVQEAVGERTKLMPERDLAYIVYSSGTTGLPKGVMLTHLNSVSNMFMVSWLEGQSLKWNKDKILSVLPFYHIYGLQCLVQVPAYLGITTIVMSSFNLKDFLSIIQDHKVTYTYVAPPIIVHLAKHPLVSSFNLSSLRAITSGAAPLTKELIQVVHDRLGIEVKQAYGLSETGPVTHLQRKWDQGIGSIGPPLPNQITKFMSPDGTENPPGTPREGELWIAGPNVFIGYLGNISATVASKTPDGFFKTGDIGYEDADGNVFITDRVKELIKYKGFQVAPAELEGLLNTNELVADAAVIGIQDDKRYTEVPMAFVVPNKGVIKNEENGKKIERWVAERVAVHKKLRGGVRWVDEIPKTASGKILRRVLKEMVVKTMLKNVKATL